MPNSNARKNKNLGNNDNETLLYILQYTLLIYWNFIKSVTLTFPNDLDLLITLKILLPLMQAHVTTNIHIVDKYLIRRQGACDVGRHCYYEVIIV